MPARQDFDFDVEICYYFLLLQGDGGSPLVCNNAGQWQVIGLVAWGIGCANGGVPGVYVNVLSYIPWITGTFV